MRRARGRNGHGGAGDPVTTTATLGARPLASSIPRPRSALTGDAQAADDSGDRERGKYPAGGHIDALELVAVTMTAADDRLANLDHGSMKTRRTALELYIANLQVRRELLRRLIQSVGMNLLRL